MGAQNARMGRITTPGSASPYFAGRTFAYLERDDFGHPGIDDLRHYRALPS